MPDVWSARDWLDAAQFIVMSSVSVLVWLIGRARAVSESRLHLIERELAKLSLETLRDIFATIGDRDAIWREVNRLRDRSKE